MEVIPAIDIRGGRCVRLYQGDYGRETVYSEDPASVARHWAGLGARRLHLVDLDGARSGTPANLDAVKAVLASATIPVQLGGGIRSLEAAREAVALGVDRVMVGTAAIEAPGLVEALCRELGQERVIVSLDARNGYVATWGWTHDSQVRASDLVQRMAEMGVQRLMYTDITRDGTLTGPNFQAIQALLERTRVRLLVAGGISSLGHLQRLAELGVEGAIVGKALYTGDIDLAGAIEAMLQYEQSLRQGF